MSPLEMETLIRSELKGSSDGYGKYTKAWLELVSEGLNSVDAFDTVFDRYDAENPNARIEAIITSTQAPTVTADSCLWWIRGHEFFAVSLKASGSKLECLISIGSVATGENRTYLTVDGSIPRRFKAWQADVQG